MDPQNYDSDSPTEDELSSDEEYNSSSRVAIQSQTSVGHTNHKYGIASQKTNGQHDSGPPTEDGNVDKGEEMEDVQPSALVNNNGLKEIESSTQSMHIQEMGSDAPTEDEDELVPIYRDHRTSQGESTKSISQSSHSLVAAGSSKNRLIDVQPVHDQATRTFADRLSVYIQHPERHENVIYYDNEFVVIRDKYPKALVHWLIIPRSANVTHMHPLKALRSEQFVRRVKILIEELMPYAAQELLHYTFAPFPAEYYFVDTEGEKNVTANGFKAGIHAHPSMNNLHIHLISRDMVSNSLKKPNHYLTFNSMFFVPLEGAHHFNIKALPHDILRGELICWKCHRNFGRQLQELKCHLQDELDIERQHNDEVLKLYIEIHDSDF